MSLYTLKISSVNYSGQVADITFYPCTGGTINIGLHQMPYDYESDDIFGDYTLYFSGYNSTCTFSVPCASPTPTPTPTMTPTPTGVELINPLLIGNDEYLEVGNDEYLMF